MTEAPERIWVDLKSDSEVWTFYEKDAFSQDVCFVRADTHDALVKAADELAEALVRIEDLTCHDMGMSARDERAVNKQATDALIAYRKARGGKKKTNWRDDPEAIVEDDEPMIGRDYE